MTAAAPAGALVIFGISGDLARKMTFRALYHLEAARHLGCPVIGVAVDRLVRRRAAPPRPHGR